MQHLNHQLSQLNLNGCKAALAHQNQHPEHHRELSFEERLSLLLEQELAARQQRKVERLLLFPTLSSNDLAFFNQISVITVR